MRAVKQTPAPKDLVATQTLETETSGLNSLSPPAFIPLPIPWLASFGEATGGDPDAGRIRRSRD